MPPILKKLYLIILPSDLLSLKVSPSSSLELPHSSSFFSIYPTHTSFLLIMGNMANMSVNRWGNNLFWFNQFFNNFHHPVLVQKFFSIEHILLNFFKYGVNTSLTSHLFTRFVLPLGNENFKYFRYRTKTDPLPNEKEKYRIRSANENILFPSFWLFRFQENLILFINFFTLSPLLPPSYQTPRQLTRKRGNLLPSLHTLKRKKLQIIFSSPSFHTHYNF